MMIAMSTSADPGDLSRPHRRVCRGWWAPPSGNRLNGVPTAVAVFPGDATIRSLAERSHRIVRWTEHDRGGHFASLQAPDLLIADIRAFADELGSLRPHT
jgi:hypothetical protein